MAAAFVGVAASRDPAGDCDRHARASPICRRASSGSSRAIRFPTSAARRPGNRAIAVAQSVHSGEALVILLSGGASALMASPIDGHLARGQDRHDAADDGAGADIHALNTVRRHLSRVKGGRLAAACVGTTITLAISDVVGDDLHAIGSGPGRARRDDLVRRGGALERFGGDAHSRSRSTRDRARASTARLPDTPKPGRSVAGARDGARDRQPQRCDGRRASAAAERWLSRDRDAESR